MKKYRTYKHEACTDVAIEVMGHPLFIPEKKGYKIKVSWINIVNPNNVFSLNVRETIFVKTADYMKWKEYIHNG